MALPTGTVTFLFTDVEGSTKLLNAHPDAYRRAVRRHHDLLLEAVHLADGAVFETVGDAVYASFARPTDAIKAALHGQRALHTEEWGETPIKVRMGLHLGEAELQDGHYFGAALYRCARLMATAHGGQTVLSQPVADLVADALPPAEGLKDLGEHRLKDLARPERIFQLTHPDLSADFPPLRTLDTLPNNLPVQLTSFVGREREIAEARRLLEGHAQASEVSGSSRCRLITLTGPGGTGKTRLALQVATDVLDSFPDGVWVVELAPLADAARLPQAVATVLGVREQPERALLATLTETLRTKHLLLVLDNCEHLIDACAAFVDSLLRACPTVCILATSREALGIAGETPRRVPSLSLPPLGDLVPALPAQPAQGDTSDSSAAALSQYESARLFVERAVTVRPSFSITEQNAAAVAELCHRLDGIPLALELAAARLNVLPVEELLRRLADRFRLLTGGSRTALERHQTLQAAVDWSYDLLSEQEKTLFTRLSVFTGGWTLDAAEAVCAGGAVEPDAVLDLLAHLVAKSLVVTEDAPDGAVHYRLLETLRQYGRQKLVASGEADRVGDRHAAHYLHRARAGADGVQLAGIHAFEAEHGNLRAALEWLTQRARMGDAAAAEDAVQLAVALAFYWQESAHATEGRQWLDQLLALPAAGAIPPSLRARALGRASFMAYQQDDFAAARAHTEHRLEIARASGDTAQIANGILLLARLSRDPVEKVHLFEESLALSASIGVRPATDVAFLGFALRRDDPARGRVLLEEARAAFHERGDGNGAGVVLRWLGALATDRGEYDAARALFAESLSILRKLELVGSIADTLSQFGQLGLAQHDPHAARDAFGEALRLHRTAGRRGGIAGDLNGLAQVAQGQGRPSRALRLAGAADALHAAFEGLPVTAATEKFGVAWRTLGEEVAREAWSEGQRMSQEHAIEYALRDERDDSMPAAASGASP